MALRPTNEISVATTARMTMPTMREMWPSATAVRASPPVIQATAAHPIWTMVFNAAMTLLGHQPKAYRLTETTSGQSSVQTVYEVSGDLTLAKTSGSTKRCGKPSGCTTEHRGEDDDDNGLSEGCSKSGYRHPHQLSISSATHSSQTPIPGNPLQNTTCSSCHWPTRRTCSFDDTTARGPCLRATSS